jgi:dipeptidyl aminopeptidase/acylaminoacyl peptidase
MGLLAAAAPAWATYPGASGRIFFTAREPHSDLGCGIASTRPNGTGYNCLYRGGRDPAVSPDRRRLAFVDGDRPTEIYSASIRGKGIHALTNASGDFPGSYSPSFSPDSNSILYFTYGLDSDGLWLMSADGGGKHQLTTDDGQEPVFSPNGALIAYQRTGIRIANADGSASHLIIEDQNHTTSNPVGRHVETNQEASWAPDGSRLAFARDMFTQTLAAPSTDDVDVWSMNPDGGDLRRLTSTPGYDEVDPSYSPDGRMIAYYRRPHSNDERGEVWVMNADGSGQRRVALGSYPEWSSVQGGPKRPRVTLRFFRLEKHRSCLGQLDGFGAYVKTTGERPTRFQISLYIDGKFNNAISEARDLTGSVDLLGFRRHTTHRLRFVVESPAAHDRVVRSARFRLC